MIVLQPVHVSRLSYCLWSRLLSLYFMTNYSYSIQPTQTGRSTENRTKLVIIIGENESFQKVNLLTKYPGEKLTPPTHFRRSKVRK